MEWLNYHHLYYFSVIHAEGGVAAAARKLRLSHSTLSTQLRQLEEHFGAALFDRRGKRLVLTSFGAEAASYASDIFRLGGELTDVARGRKTSGRDVLRIGVVPGLPKTLVHRLLSPALDDEGTRVSVRQDAAAVLLEALVGGRLHLVLMNEVPVTPVGARLHAHALGSADILLYARARLAQRAKRGYPASLHGMPFVLPPSGTPLRLRLDAWFAQHDVRVNAKAEVDDGGLLRAFGVAGRGVFPVRSTLRAEVDDVKGLHLVGACDGIRENHYAVSTERRIRHRGVAAIVDAARADFMAGAHRRRRRRAAPRA